MQTGWQSIEWHKSNLFLGNAGINTSLQNRFDARPGAFSAHSPEHVEALFTHWEYMCKTEGLQPTKIETISVFSTFMQDYIPIDTASHSFSRSIKAALGRISRRDRKK